MSVETTLPVGTTRGRVAPALAAGSGLRGERDFWTVHSPERVFSGRVFRDLETYPKLVGGLSADGEARAAELYAAFLTAEVRRMGSAEAAELTKLAETTYRDVNIAFANELARFADTLGLEVGPVIDAANSQPFSHIHRPGVAVGGHCIPVYPRFLLAGDADARLPRVAREVNEAHARVRRAPPGGRAGARRPGRAPRARARRRLPGRRQGDRVLAARSRCATRSRATAPRSSWPTRSTTPASCARSASPPWDGGPVAGAVLQADHAVYRALGPDALPGAEVVVDGRGVLDPAPFAAAGVRLLRLGGG